MLEEFLVDHAEAWAALEERDRPAKGLFFPIELFYDNVLKKRAAAAGAFAGIKAAARARKH